MIIGNVIRTNMVPVTLVVLNKVLLTVFVATRSPYTNRVDAGQLLRELHNDPDSEWHLQRGRPYQLHHGEVYLCLIGRFLCPHLFYILLDIVGRSQSS